MEELLQFWVGSAVFRQWCTAERLTGHDVSSHLCNFHQVSIGQLWPVHSGGSQVSHWRNMMETDEILFGQKCNNLTTQSMSGLGLGLRTQ